MSFTLAVPVSGLSRRLAYCLAAGFAALVVVPALAGEVVPAAEAWRVGWPTALGPTGNRLPLRTDTPLVDDLAQARLAWLTEDRSLGTAKTGSQTWANSTRVEYHLGPDAKVFKGNWAGVIVANGRVYGSSWVPAGKVYTAPYKTNRPYQKGETEQVPTRFRVEADDVVVCYDAANGKLLWKAAEPGGLIRAGGKRGGLQVAMAYDAGTVYAVGSTGRLFAYDAATGEKRWQGDVGPAHAAAEADKKQSLADAAAGKVVIPDGVDWFTSLVVADGVLVTGSYQGAQDTGLRGYDAATGKLKWTLPKCIAEWSTPALWKHDGKTWLLTATNAGTMELIDPQAGKVAWTVSGLGKNWSSLAPGDDIVVVNVRPSGGPKDKRVYGIWGAYHLSPEKAEMLWKMPDEPRNAIPTWMDTGARQFAAVRDGRVLLATEGLKAENAPGRALLLDAKTGAVLAEADRMGSKEFATMSELILWTGERAYVRADHSHGPNHGGRHPIIAWEVRPGRLGPIVAEGRFSGLDLADFDTAYEVLMHVPLVDGRMFERTEDGRLACYDLRRPANLVTWSVELAGANVGLPPLPVRLWTDGPAVVGAKDWVPDGEEAAMPLGTVRRRAMWEMCQTGGLTLGGNTLSGQMLLGFGSHKTPVGVSLTRAGETITGTWTRKIPALAETKTAKGTILGQVSPVRGYPTPWLKDQPWTPAGRNPPGTVTISMGLDGAVTLREGAAGLNLLFDHDGKAFIRAGGNAFRYSQSWHEVDASKLVLKDRRIAGTLTVIVNKDLYLEAKDDSSAATAGSVVVDATIDGEGKITGTYEAKWGIPLELSGPVSGKITK